MAVARKQKRLVRTQVSFEPEQFETLRRLAKKRGTSVARVLRDSVDAIEGYVEEEDRAYYDRMMSIVGIVKNAGPDDAEKHDEIIYGEGVR